MVIRPAHSDEGERLREITAAAKGFWGYDGERVRAWAASLDLRPERLAGAHAFVAEADGAAVGWAELLPPDAGVCVLEHLWVEPGRMRRGAGSALFGHAAERAAGLGAAAMEWEAEPNALGFYARMGGRPVRTTSSEWGRELTVMGVPLPR
ncbi:MAG TPA: GNAT family N-acetyltransferase [Gaiellales bacterium]|nr:GNAT family N-acetyltransferase [Gaiellales bacterium]